MDNVSFLIKGAMKHYFYKYFLCGRSRGSTGKGKDSEYENLESENGGDDSEGEDADADAGGSRPLLLASSVVGGQPPAPLRSGRDSEQREIDEFEEEERRLLAEEAKVRAFSCSRFLLRNAMFLIIRQIE
jgi:hypothetical protein